MVPVVQRVEQDLRDVSKLAGVILLRVDQIDNLGRFGTLKQKSPQFSELTLVFARNGHGKSTVGSTLRSLAEQDANIMHARRRLGAGPGALTKEATSVITGRPTQMSCSRRPRSVFNSR